MGWSGGGLRLWPDGDWLTKNSVHHSPPDKCDDTTNVEPYFPGPLLVNRKQRRAKQSKMRRLVRLQGQLK